MNIFGYYLLYMIYSFLGWVVEVIDILIVKKKFVNRGFLIGPYCPIYGKALLLVIWLLNRYLDDPFTLFIMSMLICALIEYITSYILEKCFKTRWWDYSHKKYNINGRICLENLIPFGLGCVLVMYIINPFLVNIITNIPNNIVMTIAIIIFICYVVDYIFSFKIILKFKNISQNLRQDNTEKVTEYVKKEILNMNKILYSRLINSFPKLKILKSKKEKK